MKPPTRRVRGCLAAALFALAGCSSGSATSGPALEGREWSLVALQGRPLGALPLQRIPRIELREGRVAGTSGCNRLSGSYTARGAALSFGPTAGTRMMCADGMDLERAFLALLGEVAGWRAGAAGIELLDAGGAALAAFSSALRSYTCSDGSSLLVRYEPGAPRQARATLSLDGAEYALRTAPAASGARYVVEQGRRPDLSLEWHTKGDEGTLLEAPLSDSRKPEDLKAFATCRAR